MIASRLSPYAAGQTVDDRYFLEELIGRGGMAEVYRARDEKTGARLALKRALSGSERARGRRQLLLEREYHTLAQLAHPRIIEVYAYGVTPAGAYYTMELLEGGDLAQGGSWPWSTACALLADVASSLSILHSRGYLHRDISASNVRRGLDGRAKLIDFGALSSIGVALEVVGTPPYVPPEALQMQVLDARADLFALGALAYYLLTGRHAFAARKLGELRDVWRSPPLSLSRLAPETPESLNLLVMQLLSLDRMARPPSAAEVMRRLCSIAALPTVEDSAVSRAYLTMPLLVGREALQLASRKALLRLNGLEGAVLLIEGPAGSGRTRALDACVLDGRLLGAHVARADAGLGAADWTVARSLCAQLFDAMPTQAAAAARPLLPWFGPLVSELSADFQSGGEWPERNALIRGLRDFILALGERERVVVAVDDVDRIDDPSLAFLAALAGHAENRSVVLAVTLDVASRARHDPSLEYLRARGQLVALQPLTADHTQRLLRSVFGDLAHVPMLAERMYTIAHGSPRDTLELAEHLVERGLARYEAGSWSLPARISDSDLPRSMAATLLQRVRALTPDALAIAQLTAVTEQPSLSFSLYERLCHDWDHARLFAALSELLSKRMLLNVADHYVWSQRTLVPVLIDAMSPERLRQVHARWASALETAGADPLLRAAHWLEAGELARSVALMLTVDLRQRHPSALLLERALEQSCALDLPLRQVRELELGMLSASVFALDVARFGRWAPVVVEALETESGIAAYRELAHVAKEQRLTAALQLTRERRLQKPERERGLEPEEAIAQLMRLSNAYTVVGLWTLDLGVLASYPDFTPLTGLSPIVGVMESNVRAAEAWVSGRAGLALETYAALLERLQQDDAAGLDRVQHSRACNVAHLLLGRMKAAYGIRDTERHAVALEAELMFRASAWRIRELSGYSQGNQIEASSCGRRADLLSVQQRSEQVVAAGTESTQLIGAIRVGDLLAVRAALENVAPLATRLSGWLPVQLYGEAECASLQAEWAKALSLAERGAALAPIGKHYIASMLVAVRVQALCALGRVSEAIDIGTVCSKAIARESIEPTTLFATAMARALSVQTRHAEAFEYLERARQETAALSMTGVLCGYLYETIAYVALAADSPARFEAAFSACALEYKKGHNSLLGARLARLFEAAQKKQMRVAQLAGLLDEGGLHVIVGDEQLLLRERFGECVDRIDRAHCALSLVLSQGERASGHLFGLSPEGPILLGGIPSDDAPEGMHAWISAWSEQLPLTSSAEQPTQTLEASSEGEFTATQTEAATSEGEGWPGRLRALNGREYEPIELALPHDARAIVAVFVLEVGPGTRLMPTRALLGRIAELLCSYGDLSY